MNIKELTRIRCLDGGNGTILLQFIEKGRVDIVVRVVLLHPQELSPGWADSVLFARKVMSHP